MCVWRVSGEHVMGSVWRVSGEHVVCVCVCGG